MKLIDLLRFYYENENADFSETDDFLNYLQDIDFESLGVIIPKDIKERLCLYMGFMEINQGHYLKYAFEWFEKIPEIDPVNLERIKSFIETYSNNIKEKDFENVFEIAQCYYHGRFVEKNYEKSFSLFKELADLEYDKSYMYLSKMYKEGQGVDQDFEKALYWLEEHKDAFKED